LPHGSFVDPERALIGALLFHLAARQAEASAKQKAIPIRLGTAVC
jgi:hypothetical protein